MTRNSVNPIYADITSIDRGKAGVYSVRGSSTWKTIDVMKSWRYHSSLYSPRFTPKKRKLFPLSKGKRDRMPRKLSSILGKQLRCWPTPKLPPSEAFPFNRREFIYLPALSLSLFSKLSKFEFPRPWKFHVSFEATSNWEVRMNGLILETFSRVAWWSKRYGNFDRNWWGYRSFIIRNRIVCISEDCINTIIGTMFLEGVSIVFLIRWARDLSTP